MADKTTIKSASQVRLIAWPILPRSSRTRALDGMRHAVRRHFHQLYGSPGDCDSRSQRSNTALA